MRDYPVKFRRQTIISHFIVDFYCPSAKLVIELDGAQHYTDQGQAYDAERGNILAAYGCKVLRFTNVDIDAQFDAVCEQIDHVVRANVE